jgi:hypothetical protein
VVDLGNLTHVLSVHLEATGTGRRKCGSLIPYIQQKKTAELLDPSNIPHQSNIIKLPRPSTASVVYTPPKILASIATRAPALFDVVGLAALAVLEVDCVAGDVVGEGFGDAVGLVLFEPPLVVPATEAEPVAIGVEAPDVVAPVPAAPL